MMHGHVSLTLVELSLCQSSKAQQCPFLPERFMGNAIRDCSVLGL